MIPCRIVCPACRGAGGSWVTTLWTRCRPCDGVGFTWAPGAPRYGLPSVLSDTTPGEVVTIGTGEQARVLWHQPRKTKKVTPDTTFLGMIDPFTEVESHRPVPYPSCVGVLSVDVSRAKVDSDPHAGEKTGDRNDPVQRTVAGGPI